MSGQRSLPKRWHVSAGRNRKVRKTNPSYYMPLPLPHSLFLLCSNIMTFTPLSPLPCVYDGEDDEEEIILSGCKLVIMAAGIIGTRHRRTRQRRTALFRVRHSVESIYRGMGDKYFRRAYRMNYESFCNLHDKLEDGIELFRLKSRGYNKKGGRAGGNYSLPPTPNGPITSSVRLAGKSIQYHGEVWDLSFRSDGKCLVCCGCC